MVRDPRSCGLGEASLSSGHGMGTYQLIDQSLGMATESQAEWFKLIIGGFLQAHSSG